MAQEMVQTVWLGLSIAHPADWEPARLGLDVSHARCVLVDRYSQRMSVHWRPSKLTPDLKRMYDHYRRQVGKDHQEDLPGLGGWEGFVQRQDQQWLTRAGRYFPDAHRLVEVVLAWSGGRDRDLERRLLTGIRPQDPQASRRLWQALGLSVAVPRGLRMRKYLAQPGHVRFEFQARRGGVSVHRLALVGDWLKEPLEQWLQRRADAGRVEQAQPCEVRGHEGFELLTSRPAALPRRLLGKRRWQRQRAWVCPSCRRLYLTDAFSVARQELPDEAVEVGCCGPIERAAQR